MQIAAKRAAQHSAPMSAGMIGKNEKGRGVDMDAFKHNILPAPARELLQRAAQTKPTPKDPLAQQKAIDAAVNKLRREYPNHFKGE